VTPPIVRRRGYDYCCRERWGEAVKGAEVTIMLTTIIHKHTCDYIHAMISEKGG